MSRKEQYLAKETLEDDIRGILQRIKEAGTRDRGFGIKGKPALLVTDMQEYFLSPGSHAFIPSAEAIIPNILKLIEYFEEHHYLILYTQHLNNEDDAGNMKTWWNDIISENSEFSSLSPVVQSFNRSIVQSINRSIDHSFNPLPLSPSPLLLLKPQYDAFHHTDLEDILKKNGIETLIICGVMTNLCCETSLRSAFVRGFNAILPVDATATYKRDFHVSTFVNLSFGFCPVKDTAEILNTLNG